MGCYYVKVFLVEWFGIDKEEFLFYLIIYENDGVIEYLYWVVCGLDLMVIGEI